MSDGPSNAPCCCHAKALPVFVPHTGTNCLVGGIHQCQSLVNRHVLHVCYKDSCHNCPTGSTALLQPQVCCRYVESSTADSQATTASGRLTECQAACRHRNTLNNTTGHIRCPDFQPDPLTFQTTGRGFCADAGLPKEHCLQLCVTTSPSVTPAKLTWPASLAHHNCGNHTPSTRKHGCCKHNSPQAKPPPAAETLHQPAL